MKNLIKVAAGVLVLSVGLNAATIASIGVKAELLGVEAKAGAHLGIGGSSYNACLRTPTYTIAAIGIHTNVLGITAGAGASLGIKGTRSYQKASSASSNFETFGAPDNFSF